MNADEDKTTVDAALFEGMFMRAVRPDPPFAAELRELGFDLGKMQPRYPMRVWRSSLNAARRRLFGERSERKGFRALGNLFVQGYFETIIGKVLAIPLALVPVEKVIQRMPKTWHTARADLQLDPPVKEGPQRWRVTFHDAFPMPEFIAGVVEGASRRTRVKQGVNVDVEKQGPQGFDLVIWW